MEATPRNPWRIYDQLIEGVPTGIAVHDYCMGSHWSYVRAESGMGISYTVSGGARSSFSDDPRALQLHELAALVKSWNFGEASLGIAALNAWYSQRDRVEAMGAHIDEEHEGKSNTSNPFWAMKERYAGKKVTIIGHFPHIEDIMRVARVTILERNCASPLDTPDPACEYLLPEQDFVFMTGITLTNKTAPRLLELARQATVGMVGPSAIPAPVLFDAGVNVMAGSVVIDAEPAMFAVKGGSKQLWRSGIKKFSIER